MGKSLRSKPETFEFSSSLMVPMKVKVDPFTNLKRSSSDIFIGSEEAPFKARPAAPKIRARDSNLRGFANTRRHVREAIVRNRCCSVGCRQSLGKGFACLQILEFVESSFNFLACPGAGCFGSTLLE